MSGGNGGRPTVDELKRELEGDTRYRLSRHLRRRGELPEQEGEAELRTYAVEVEEEVKAVRRMIYYVQGATDAEHAEALVRDGHADDVEVVELEEMDGPGHGMYRRVLAVTELDEEGR